MKDELPPMEAAAWMALMQRVEPILKEEMRRRGVSSPADLHPDEAARVFDAALLGVTAQHFPSANLDQMRHTLRSFQHPRFGSALTGTRAGLGGRIDPFEPTVGIDAAIVFAGAGLPVCPIDKRSGMPLGTPTNDIDQVVDAFRNLKTAYVGFSSATLPFYIVTTDCLATFSRLLKESPAFSALREVCRRHGEPTVTASRPFEHALLSLPRDHDLHVATHVHSDPHPDRGSVAVYAGWVEGGIPVGCPNSGIAPVPKLLLYQLLKNAEIQGWFWRPVGVKALIH